MIYCHGTPSAEKVPGVPWSLHATRRGRSPWRCEACSMGKAYFPSGFTCSNRAGVRCARSSSGSGVTTGGRGAAGFFCDTEEARDLRLAKTPIYVGVRLPLRLQLWPEMWAGEEHVSTSRGLRTIRAKFQIGLLTH